MGHAGLRIYSILFNFYLFISLFNYYYDFFFLPRGSAHWILLVLPSGISGSFAVISVHISFFFLRLVSVFIGRNLTSSTAGQET